MKEWKKNADRQSLETSKKVNNNLINPKNQTLISSDEIKPFKRRNSSRRMPWTRRRLFRRDSWTEWKLIQVPRGHPLSNRRRRRRRKRWRRQLKRTRTRTCKGRPWLGEQSLRRDWLWAENQWRLLRVFQSWKRRRGLWLSRRWRRHRRLPAFATPALSSSPPCRPRKNQKRKKTICMIGRRQSNPGCLSGRASRRVGQIMRRTRKNILMIKTKSLPSN